MKRLASFLLVQIMVLFLAACGEGGPGIDPQDGHGVKYGGIGGAMSTEWFDFTVTDAYSCDRYQGYSPSEGYKLVVVAMTLENNCGRPVDVWGEDFVLRWGDGDDTLDIPLPAGLSGDQFPDEYALDVNETKSGVMVFEAPRGFQEFNIVFTELFEPDADPDGGESGTDPDVEEGDTFFVEFTVEDRG